MATLTSLDHFLQVLQRSGLVERSRLDALLEAQKSAPTDAGSLAALLVRDGILTSFQARQLLAGKSQGFTILGKYKILDILGTGGMGKVYLCEHMMLRRLVAVKVLPQTKTASPTAVERFYREARAVAALDHPNIVRCFDVDRDGAVHFMVMEYVDGVGLDNLVQHHGPLSAPRMAHYIRQAALGLQHAHEAGWVHRDIKPGNILLDRSGVVKLLDLGLARLFADVGDNLTQQHNERAVLGTADYIAPEQAVSSHEVDIRADIYSLGCTAYFLVAGRAPFREGTIAQKLIWHQVREPESLSHLKPETPAELVAVVQRMLAKDPGQRFQTPADVVAALEPWTTTPIPPPSDAEMPRADASSFSAVSDHSVIDSDLWISPTAPPASQVSRWRSDPSGTGQTLSGRRAPTPTPSSEGRSSQTNVSASGLGDSSTRNPRSTVHKIRQGGPQDTVRKLPPAGPQDTVRKKSSSATGPLYTMSGPPTEPMEEPAPSAPTPRPPARAPRKYGLFIGAAITLLAAGSGIGWMLSRSNVSPSTPGASIAEVRATRASQPEGPAPLVVTRNRFSEAWGKPNTFDSLAKAVAAAKAGDRIQLLDANVEEHLDLDGRKQAIPPNLTIESNRPATDASVWRRPSDRPQKAPLLSLTQVDGLTVKGTVVFNGEGEVDHLIKVSGRCPGLRFEGVQLTNFKQSAVQLQDCTGEAKAPITLTGLRISRRDAAGALLVAPGTGASHVRVSNCRLEGPFTAAVQIDGPLLSAQFQHNRFYQVGAAFRIGATPLQLDLSRNTICEATALFQLTGFPPLEGTTASRITLSGNLIAHTPALLQSEAKLSPEKVKSLFVSDSNVRDKETAKDAVTFPGLKEMPFELKTGAADDQFLRYPPSSNLSTAGPNGGPVGVPPG
jgi:serine/threonine protein kinase